MDWQATWIWHPATDRSENFYCYARRVFTLDRVAAEVPMRITASSLYKLFINGCYVGRGPNPSDPSFHYYDVYDVVSHLRTGTNVIAIVAYTYCEAPSAILGQNWGRGGILLELGERGAPFLVSDGDWRVLQAPPWDQDAPINCTLLGDYKEYYDSRREIDGWMDADFDDGDWSAPQVIGSPPVEPWTRLVERPIPMLREERIEARNAYWESASTTYAWREDWEVYGEQSLVREEERKGTARQIEVTKTHDDFSPSIILDFGRLVTGYLEIAVADSQGGVIDLLYGETLNMTRVDRFTLRGGAQTLEPFNRRSFRYLKLLFADTPATILIDGVAIRESLYPVERRGSFRCSDPQLDRIYDMAVDNIRICMVDHFVDSPWRERAIAGGDMYAEHQFAAYAFGDYAMHAKCLRLIFGMQNEDGSLSPYGPYRTFPYFYANWLAYFGLCALEHYRLSGDRDLLEELWPNLQRLFDWSAGIIDADPRGLMKVVPKNPAYQEWLERPGFYNPVTNLPFWSFFARLAACAEHLDRPAAERQRYRASADALAAAIREHLVDPSSGLVGRAGRTDETPFGQYDCSLLLWSGFAEEHVRDIAAAVGGDELAPIASPFHAHFVGTGLFENGAGELGLDFIRRYFGDMLRRGTIAFWEHFSLAWTPHADLDRGLSISHGWCAGPCLQLPAYVLGVRPLEPGFARVRIEPFCGDLDWAAGTVTTPHGDVHVRWQCNRDRLRLECNTPRPAEIRLPAGNRYRPRLFLDGRECSDDERADRCVSVEAGSHTVELRQRFLAN